MISDAWTQMLDAAGPLVLQWGKPIALGVLSLIALLGLLMLALAIQQVGAERSARRRRLTRAYPWLHSDDTPMEAATVEVRK